MMEDDEGADLGCPTFWGSSQMTKWIQDLFFFSIREAPKTTDVQFHSYIFDKSLNLQLQYEFYMHWVFVGTVQ